VTLPYDDNVLPVNAQLVIPRAELEYRASRAGGPGGQHVNTSSTRIELLWDFARSPGVSEGVRARIVEKLGARLDAEGRLRVVAANERSQAQNRAAAEDRLVELIRKALIVARPRKRTKVPRAVKESRLREKKRRGDVKRNRRAGSED
jgi:ribosome-associated protein